MKLSTPSVGMTGLGGAVSWASDAKPKTHHEVVAVRAGRFSYVRGNQS